MPSTPDSSRVESFAARIRARYPDAPEARVLAKARELASQEAQQDIPPQRPVPEPARPLQPSFSSEQSIPQPVTGSPRLPSHPEFRRGLKFGGGAGIAIGFLFALLLFADYSIPGITGPSSNDFAFRTDAISLKVRRLTNPDGNVGVYVVRHLGSTYEVVVDFDTMEFSALNSFNMQVKDERKARLIFDAAW